MAGHLKRRTYKRADGSTREVWRARYPDPTRGGTAQIERSFSSKREAESWVKRQGVSVLDGNHVDPRRGERPLAEVADAWRETWTDLEPKTRAGYDHILRLHILPRFGRAKVGAVSTEVVQRFVNELATTRAPNTVRRIYTVLRSVLRVAVERHYIGHNPCDSVRLPRKGASGHTPKRITPLTHAQAHALADAMPAAARWRLAVLLAAYTGLRAGELWALRHDDINLLRRELTVDEALKDVSGRLMFGPTKTHQTRHVPLPQAALDLLAALPAPAAHIGPNALLFTAAEGGPVRHGQFCKRTFKPTVRATLPPELHGLRWHDLRHTCASWLIERGAHPLAVMKYLGHEDIRTTMNTYGHMFPSGERALADALDAGWREAQTAGDNLVPIREAS